MRRSVSSRPSSATLSKIPGETVVPAIATRTGWKTCSASSRGARRSRAVRLDRVLVERRQLARARARLRERLRAAVRAEPALERARVVDRPVERKPASGQKSASVWIFSWLISTPPRSPSRPVNASRRCVSSSSEQVAHVAAVHVRAASSRRRRPATCGSARARSAAPARRSGSSSSSSSEPAAEQRDVVAHRLGQVAGVAQLLHGGGAVALGELLAVGAVQQRQVRVARRRLAAAPRARAAAWACSRGGPRRARRA